MVTCYENGVFLQNGVTVVPAGDREEFLSSDGTRFSKEEGRKGTIAYHILQSHNRANDMSSLRLTFDAMASHDITFVGIIQTARASGMTTFPMPYVLTNCHNSLCAVGGTINEDDHMFGLSAAQKYGGIYVPPHIAVIHQYMREMHAGCGKMILGSDSHTRYGALGTMAIGEGGGELVKQLLGDTYDITYPDVVGIYLHGTPKPYVGPMDIALAIIGAVYPNGLVKNKVMEFVGPGIRSMTTDFRNGIDVMTTETTCLSSIWETDEDTRAYLTTHGREADYQKLHPDEVAYYDAWVDVDLDQIEPMIALPFHPSNVYTIDALLENREDILREVEKTAADVAGGRAEYHLLDKIEGDSIRVQQGIIAGCAGGTYSNIAEASRILAGASCGSGAFSLDVYPASQPVYLELVRNGAVADLVGAGAIVKTAFCGPCFGAGDTPSHGALSIRHTTRNFPNREGAKPGNGQMAAVALMDARSIAATASRGGLLTSAKECGAWDMVPAYTFDQTVYGSRVYQGYGCAKPDVALFDGPNIKAWPEQSALSDHILLRICTKIMDDVTTTDELIPSGETSSFRSNPLGLAEYTLSRRDPAYVGRSKETREAETARRSGEDLTKTYAVYAAALDRVRTIPGMQELDALDIEIGSCIYARRPGDGSAREQAASCQRVIGGLANIAMEYATKRYRSNVMNWGMLPFRLTEEPDMFEVGDFVFVPHIRQMLMDRTAHIPAYVLSAGGVREIALSIDPMTDDEIKIILAGCLINYNRNKGKDRQQA